jgi:hypothetical protein
MGEEQTTCKAIRAVRFTRFLNGYCGKMLLLREDTNPCYTGVKWL